MASRRLFRRRRSTGDELSFGPRSAAMRNPEREVHYFRIRIAVATVFVLAAFITLLARLAWLQVVKHDAYMAQAELNRIAILPVAPNRGLIKDRNGKIIARNYSAYTLEITPEGLRDHEKTIDAAGAGDRSAGDATGAGSRNCSKTASSFDAIPIRTRLTDAEVARFSAQRYRFPHVELRARLFRDYPLGEIASHMIGYIGRISPDDMDRIEKRGEATAYQGTHHIGKVGIEQSYEAELHGTAGHEEVEITAGGRAVRTLSRTASMPGNNLVLSVDIELQKIAEKAFGNRRGALIAIEPKTGDVLAFVAMPTFDPNLFVDGIDPKSWDELNNDPGQAAAESRVARHVSDRLDLQAVPGAGSARNRQAPGRPGDPGQRRVRIRQPALSRFEQGAAGAGRSEALDRQVERRVLLHAGQRSWRRHDSRLHEAVEFWPDHRHRCRRRADRDCCHRRRGRNGV